MHLLHAKYCIVYLIKDSISLKSNLYSYHGARHIKLVIVPLVVLVWVMMEGCRLVSSGSETGGVGSMLESRVTGEGREMVLSSRRTLRGCGETGGRKEVKNSARCCVQ